MGEGLTRTSAGARTRAATRDARRDEGRATRTSAATRDTRRKQPASAQLRCSPERTPSRQADKERRRESNRA